MAPVIGIDVDESGIAVVTWGSGGVAARIDADAIDAFALAVERVASDDTIRGAVLTGGAAGFGDGIHLEWLAASTSQGASALRPGLERLNDVLARIEGSSKPWIAAIAGSASGASLEVALACRARLVAAQADVQLGLLDAKLGLAPLAGGAVRLARLVGTTAAQAILFAAQPMTPAQALKAGVVDEIVAAADLLGAAKRRASQPVPPRPALSPTASNAAIDAHQPARTAIVQMLDDAAAMAPAAALASATSRSIDVACGSVSRAMVRTLGLSVARANALARRPAGFAKRSFRQVGVLGAGLMGGGIASVCARAGLDVVLVDVSGEAAGRGWKRLGEQDASAIAAGRLDPETSRATLARIQPTGDYAALREVDIVVEAVFEDRAVKAEATRRAEAETSPAIVFATNTSTLPIRGLAEASARPAQFIGLHFFSPVPRMPLLEIIRGARTSDETLAVAMDFAQRIGKTPIVANDARGFYTTRVVMAYQAEAFDMLAEGIAPERVEEGGVASGMPVPPLALSDAVALDLIHQINVQAKKDLGDAYASSPGYELVGRMVEAMARTGKKAGKGFYDYDERGGKRLWPGLREAAAKGRERSASVEDVRDRLLAVQALETARALEEGVISDPSEADVGALLGWGFAPWTGGPLSYIDAQGVARFVARCDELADRYGGQRLRPTRSLREIAASGATVYGTTWPMR